jgi:Arc/MetJ family transcription regulator
VATLFLPSCSRMHESCILIRMRTTLNINDDLLKQAARLSGITEKTAVVHAGLEALVARESAKRLAALGGCEPRLQKIRRRRPQAPRAGR